MWGGGGGGACVKFFFFSFVWRIMFSLQNKLYYDFVLADK